MDYCNNYCETCQMQFFYFLKISNCVYHTWNGIHLFVELEFKEA